MSRRSIVYGTPDQFARLLENLAALVDREPEETFAHGDVRTAAGQLAQRLGVRLGELEHPDMAVPARPAPLAGGNGLGHPDMAVSAEPRPYAGGRGVGLES